jgi:predicted dehydrogenase
MYKIAILGCENSHANKFLDFVIGNKNTPKIYSDIEVLGVFSEDRAAAEKLRDIYGVKVADSYDEFVGKVDGIIVTARHGDNHYKYAMPYLDSGIPMFIDKPITVSEEDALALREALIKNKIKYSGGSICKYPRPILELAKIVKEGTAGKVYGGMLRAPVNMNNPYGGFFFYSQHLAQVMTTMFGCYPKSVKMYKNGKIYTGVVRYEEYDVNISFVEENYVYSVGISCEKKFLADEYNFDGCFVSEFNEFYTILKGGEQPHSYKDLVAPVFILNAINRSLLSGNEEVVNTYEI